MPHAVEHPEHFIGPQNKFILDTLSDAYKIALDLCAKGHTVLCICASPICPIIILKPTGYCHQLDSTLAVKGRDNNGPYEKRATSINGCKVEWTIRRAA